MHIPIPQTIERLCYRYPSPLVDAVTEHEPGRRIVAVKNVTVNEDYLPGTFPRHAADPGVLMIETLAQVATMLVRRPGRRRLGRAYLRGVDNAKFRARSCPAIGCASKSRWAPGARSSPARTASAYIDDAIVAEAELVMGLLPDGGLSTQRGIRADPTRDRPSRGADRRGHGHRAARGHRRARADRPRTAASARRR